MGGSRGAPHAMAAHALHGMYDWRVVALSLFIASVAAYVALSLGERVTQNRGRARTLWLLGGALAMGTGIWSMHFTGMLAFHLPVAVRYDLPLVAVSLVAAVLSSGVALAVVSRPTLEGRTWLFGGVLMGGGIVTMHYTGMAAMRMSAMVRWDARIVACSVAIAVAVSLVAQRLVFRLRDVPDQVGNRRRAAAALIMGFAVAGMHYTAMAAATFVPAARSVLSGDSITAGTLGGSAIVAGTLLVLLIALAVAYLDRWIAHQLALAQTKSHFSAVVASAPVLLFALDADGVITMARGRDLARVCNDAAGCLGRSFFEVFSGERGWLEQAKRALAGEEFTEVDDVRGVVIEMRWTPVRSGGGSVSGLIAVGTDITERRRAEEALHHQAFHDDLTGLPNRAALNRRLSLAIETAAARGETLGLAVFDLNRFKEVNDTLGHDAGDALLKSAGARVREVLRESDFVSRMGGDEFAVLVPGATRSDCEDVARRIAAALEAPFVVGGHALVVGAAVGVALFPDHATDPATLLRHADVAMYLAKRSALQFALYDALRDTHSPARLMMENGLRSAIAQNEFVLHYQPTLEFATGRITGMEALVRWDHPTLGRLAPERFIPLAEETGLIVPLTRWVLDAALEQVRSWERRGRDLAVAVNLSMCALHDPELPGTVERLLTRHGVAPHRLTLEVTESTLMSDLERARESLRRLNALGVSISVDDFGTGYSSLSYLAQLPVAELKIDKSFVMAMHTDRRNSAIVQWVNGLGHVLGLRVVAEGVETIEAFETLAALGCDVAQGYYLSPPLPACEVDCWLRESQWHSDEVEPAAISA